MEDDPPLDNEANDELLPDARRLLLARMERLRPRRRRLQRLVELRDDMERQMDERQAMRLRALIDLEGLEEPPPDNLPAVPRVALVGVLRELAEGLERIQQARAREENEGTVSEEMIKEAKEMREKDESEMSSVRFSRVCVICTTENPRQRAVFSLCGHIVCYPCAVDNARSNATGGRCVYCQSKSGFVKLFEDECSDGMNNDKDENPSLIRAVVDCGKTIGGHIHSLLAHPLTWATISNAALFGFGVVVYRRAPENARFFVGAQMADEAERLRRALVNVWEGEEDREEAAIRRDGNQMGEAVDEDVAIWIEPPELDWQNNEIARMLAELRERHLEVVPPTTPPLRATAVTEEMMREAEALREEDARNPSVTRFSRVCLICAIENPRQRAVFTQCGHIVCYPCAVDNARSSATGGKCVTCRSAGGFVKLFEEEYCSGDTK